MVGVMISTFKKCTLPTISILIIIIMMILLTITVVVIIVVVVVIVVVVEGVFLVMTNIWAFVDI